MSSASALLEGGSSVDCSASKCNTGTLVTASAAFRLQTFPAKTVPRSKEYSHLIGYLILTSAPQREAVHCSHSIFCTIVPRLNPELKSLRQVLELEQTATN
jgi:hypothetical protein